MTCSSKFLNTFYEQYWYICCTLLYYLMFFAFTNLMTYNMIQILIRDFRNKTQNSMSHKFDQIDKVK